MTRLAPGALRRPVGRGTWLRTAAEILDVWRGAALPDVSAVCPGGAARQLGLDEAMRDRVVGEAMALTASRPPDQVIERVGRPYLERWWLERGGLRSLYVHRWRGDDPDLGLHDHPADSASLVLAGCYRERWLAHGDQPDRWIRTWDLAPGDVAYRPARHAHQIHLHGPGPHLTLFIFGARARQWGFWVPSPDGTAKTLQRHPSAPPAPQEAAP